jgi:hypothetical protein
MVHEGLEGGLAPVGCSVAGEVVRGDELHQLPSGGARRVDSQHSFGAGVEQRDAPRQVGPDEGDGACGAKQVVDHPGVLPRGRHVGRRDHHGDRSIGAGPVHVGGERDRLLLAVLGLQLRLTGAGQVPLREEGLDVRALVLRDQQLPHGPTHQLGLGEPGQERGCRVRGDHGPVGAGQHDHAAGAVDHRPGVVALGLETFLQLNRLGDVDHEEGEVRAVVAMVQQGENHFEPHPSISVDPDLTGPAGRAVGDDVVAGGDQVRRVQVGVEPLSQEVRGRSVQHGGSGVVAVTERHLAALEHHERDRDPRLGEGTPEDPLTGRQAHQGLVALGHGGHERETDEDQTDQVELGVLGAASGVGLDERRERAPAELRHQGDSGGVEDLLDHHDPLAEPHCGPHDDGQRGEPQCHLCSADGDERGGQERAHLGRELDGVPWAIPLLAPRAEQRNGCEQHHRGGV